MKVDDEFVEFSANGKANVTSEIGEQLVSEYDRFEAVEDDEDSDEESTED